MSAVALRHSTFLWLELHFRTRKVCRDRSNHESFSSSRRWAGLSGTHPDRLPEQDVEGRVSAEGQLEPHGVGEQQTIQDAEGPLRAAGPLHPHARLTAGTSWVAPLESSAGVSGRVQRAEMSSLQSFSFFVRSCRFPGVKRSFRRFSLSQQLLGMRSAPCWMVGV